MQISPSCCTPLKRVVYQTKKGALGKTLAPPTPACARKTVRQIIYFITKLQKIIWMMFFCLKKKYCMTLSQQLTEKFGKGYTYSALTRIIKVAGAYTEEIFATLSQTLSWSHFIELVSIEDIPIPQTSNGLPKNSTSPLPKKSKATLTILHFHPLPFHLSALKKWPTAAGVKKTGNEAISSNDCLRPGLLR